MPSMKEIMMMIALPMVTLGYNVIQDHIQVEAHSQQLASHDAMIKTLVSKESFEEQKKRTDDLVSKEREAVSRFAKLEMRSEWYKDWLQDLQNASSKGK